MRQPESNVFNEDNMVGMARYPDKFFDLAIVDPPYFKGVGKLGYFGKKNSSLNVKRGNYAIPQWDNMIPDEIYLQELLRVSKEQIIWGINYFKFYHTAGRIVWDKVNGKSSFSDAEIASCSLMETVRIFRYLWNGMQQAKSFAEPTVQQGNKKLNEKRIHATQKPVALYTWCLRKFSQPGQKILDTHMGSQSSRIASFEMGLDYWGWEIDEHNFTAGNERFENERLRIIEQTSQLQIFQP